MTPHIASRGRILFALVLPLLPVILGCSRSPYQLSGSVTYDGNPVPVGEIVFMPDPAAGNRGPGVLAEIKDGRYEMPSNKGHIGGAYLARLTGFDGAPAKAVGLVDPRGTPLFVDVTEKLTLPEQSTTHDFAVPGQKKK
jgi:hypothetical protein